MIMSMSDRKLSAPFNASPKPGPLSLDGVFEQIIAKPSAQLEEERKVSGYLYNETSMLQSLMGNKNICIINIVINCLRELHIGRV